MFPRPFILLGWVLAACAADPAVGSPKVIWSATEVQIQAERCAVVENQGVDTIVEMRDDSGRLLRYAGTWTDRRGRYVVLVPPGTEEITLRSLGGALAPGNFAVQACPERAEDSGLVHLAEALDLRLRGYFGGKVEADAIDRAFEAALDDRMFEAMPRWAAVAHHEYGSWLWNIGRGEAARGMFVQARDRFRALGDANGEAYAEVVLGLIAWRGGLPQQAYTHYERALAINRALGEDFAAAEIENNLGLLAYDIGEHDAAVAHYDAALSVFQGRVDLRRAVASDETESLAASFRPPADLASALNTLNNLALVHASIGQADIAERYWRNYLSFEHQVAESAAPAEARKNLGSLLLNQGRLDEAMLLLTEALNVFERTQNTRWHAETLVEFALLYFRLGDHDGAIANALGAAEMQLDDARTGAGIKTSLARLLLALDDHGRAEAQLTEAVELLPQSSGIAQAWRIQVEIGRLELELGNLNRAERVLGEAAARLGEMDMLQSAARAHSLVAEVHLQRGELARARKLLERALEQQQQLDDLFGELETLERMSRLYAIAASPRELEINQRAMLLIERVGSLPLPPLREAEFRAAARSIHARQIGALLDRSRVGDAWQVAVRARGTGFTELQRVHVRAASRKTREDLLDRHGRMVNQFAEVRMQSVSGDDGARNTVAGLRRRLDRVALELKRLNTAPESYGEHASLAELQAWLGPERLLLAWDLLPDLPLMWIISADSARVEYLEDLYAVGLDVDALIEQLRHPRNAVGRIGLLVNRLRDRLLTPAGQALDQAREVLIMPDGVLHSLPFPLLLDPSDPGSPPRVVHNLMSTQRLAQNERSADSATGARMLVMADPGFGDPASSESRLPAGSLLGRLVRGGIGWQLPGTRAEAEAIAGLAGGRTEISLRTGPLATREYLLSGAAERFGTLHLATHGLVDLEFPELSSLLLGSLNAAGPSFVRPHDIAAMNLNANLVVLSACETGLGKSFAGSGAFSLARSFLIAGADTVLASLWKVDDHRTAQFMVRFYRYLIGEQRGAAESLALTQQWMRRQPGNAHPYYWAGFVLTAAGIPNREPVSAETHFKPIRSDLTFPLIQAMGVGALPASEALSPTEIRVQAHPYTVGAH